MGPRVSLWITALDRFGWPATLTKTTLYRPGQALTLDEPMLMTRRPKTYTTTEFAKLLGVSPKTVMRWEAKNAIPGADRDRNGHRVFTDADLSAARKYRDRLVPAPHKRQRSLNLQHS